VSLTWLSRLAELERHPVALGQDVFKGLLT
jgi:hypothetical protein